jgi:hypothetical protein
MLVEILASAPDVLLVEEAPLDVLLLEASGARFPRSPTAPDIAVPLQALAQAPDLSGFLLVEAADRQAMLVRIVREHLDFAVDGRVALLAAIRRAARWTEPERARA